MSHSLHSIPNKLQRTGISRVQVRFLISSLYFFLFLQGGGEQKPNLLHMKTISLCTQVFAFQLKVSYAVFHLMRFSFVYVLQTSFRHCVPLSDRYKRSEIMGGKNNLKHNLD